MWFYLPKSQAALKHSEKAFSKENIYQTYRRQKWRKFWKIREWLWCFAFLAVAARVGSVIYFTLFDYRGFDATNVYRYNSPLTMPYAKLSENNATTNHRYILLLSIHRNGNIMIDGDSLDHIEPIEPNYNATLPSFRFTGEKLADALILERIRNRRAEVRLIIDRYCEMKHVYKLLDAIKKAGFREVFFLIKEKR